ncbi:hypothetical protein [Paeniglutamicibacter antarcticus]|uniref:Uncharacterized protein n=1 Tax=Paeniglutamicibacter antarcticus TaxID=494023 RepID=A0ABP9TJM6_9MICC
MSQKTTHEWLPFYLRDHMAGARTGVRLFDRVAQGHSRHQVRTEVARTHGEVEQDCRALRVMMTDLGMRQVSLTMFMGVFGELVGRLKPNGAIFKRSIGADVLELEALVAAVEAKARLWETLIALSGSIPELDSEKLRHLQDRAGDQRDTLIGLHAQVVRTTPIG